LTALVEFLNKSISPSDSNADKDAPPGRNNKNNVICQPSFISHPNRIVLRVFKQKRRNYGASGKKRGSIAVANERSTAPSLSSSWLISDTLSETLLATKKLLVPSFISHPNGIVLCVLKNSYTPTLSETKKLSGSFICYPNGIVLQVLNQKQS